MGIVLAVIAVAILLGVYALYARMGVQFETLMREVRADREILKQELAILWVAESSEPEVRAKRRKEYGLGPLYVYDEEVASYLWPHRERYLLLKNNLKTLESRSWDYKDAADREQMRKETEDLRLEVLVQSASASAEQKAVWDKRENERFEENRIGEAK